MILDTINNDLLTTKPKSKSKKKQKAKNNTNKNKNKNKFKTKSEQQQQIKKQQDSKKKTVGARKEFNQQFNYLLKGFNHNQHQQATGKPPKHSSTSKITKISTYSPHFLNPEKIGVLNHNKRKSGKGCYLCFIILYYFAI